MKFIQAGSYYAGRTRRPRLIVLHSTQGPGAPSWAVPTAEGIAGYFSRGPGVSSHYVCDEVETIQCVADEHTAWCAPGANADGIHIEQCGYAEWSRVDWLTNGNLDMLRGQVAPLLAALSARHGIPLRALTVPEIQAGQAGVCVHWDITNAYPGGSHWDCGTGYPLDAVLEWAGGATYAPATPPEVDDDMATFELLKTGRRFHDTDPSVPGGGAGLCDVWSCPGVPKGAKVYADLTLEGGTVNTVLYAQGRRTVVPASWGQEAVHEMPVAGRCELLAPVGTPLRVVAVG